nr:hypothetical protein [Tanacetum cinerariifolium]
MAHPVQNINHSAFSMTPELHRQFKNYSPYEMLQELRSMFEKQAGVERFDLIQTLYACKQEEDFAGFVRNYNMHNMGKTIGELHAILIEYENGLPKKAETPQVMMIKGGKIKKSNKKSLEVKGKGKAIGKGKAKQVYISKPKDPKPADKEHPPKDDTCHHCKKFFRHVSRQGASYFITFTDDYSCFSYVYLLKHKREVFERFKVFKNEVENQLEKTIKALRSDRGGEYISEEFKDYLKACEIVQQLTPPYTPQHNCVSKRRNRTLLDMVRSMMNLTTLSLSFWDYALESATRILNTVPTKKVDKTPYELCGRAIDLEEIQNEDTSPSEITSKIPMEVEGFEPPQEEVIPIRRSEKTHRAPNRLCLNIEVEEHSIGDLNEPASYKVAMLYSESNKWINAINVKIQFMIDNMVLVLVDLPPGYKTVGSKWIFKKKTDVDGIIHTYKARFVAKGYTQLYGVDYEETFSPVTDIRAIRILIYIYTAAFYDYEIWKMDVKTAFLNGYLDEDIYMVQSEGFVDLNHPEKVCKLQRSSKHQKARIKDLMRKSKREAAFILGIKIYRDRSKRLIRLGQNAYMDKILKRYKMDNSKRGHIPMQERLDLNKTQGASTPKEVKRMQNVPYALANLGECHWIDVKNILKYLRNTKNMFLVYGGNPEAELRVDCYWDFGFETDRDDIKSQTGFVFILNGGAMDWKSSKKSTTAMSAT